MRIGTMTLAMAISIFSAASQGTAAPPTNAGGIGQAKSEAARTRAKGRDLVQHRLDRARSGKGTTAGKPSALPDRPTTSGRPSLTGRSTASSKARGPKTQPQAGTGRIGRDTSPRRSSSRRYGIRRALGRTKQWRESANENEKTTRGRSALAIGRQLAGLSGTERQMKKAELLLKKRLANIDHLRDIAVENGNTQMLERADKLEELAQQQYDRRIAKLTTEGPAETDNSQEAPETPEGTMAETDVETEETTLGRSTVRKARKNRRGFGQLTAEEARKLRKAFGQAKSQSARGEETPSETSGVEQAAGTTTVTE